MPDQIATAADSAAIAELPAPPAPASTDGGGSDSPLVTPPAAAPAPRISPERIAELAPIIEALLITSSRPVSPQRLSVALGLAPPESDDSLPPPPVATPTSSPDSPDQVVEIAPPRKRTRKPKPTDVSPAELIASSIALLNTQYEQTGRTFRIEALSGGYRLMTLSQFRAPIATLQGLALSNKLSRPAIETLAIIAYRQPVTRAQLEAIRGVACGEVLRSLLDRRLVTMAGRAEELGRPILYATTRAFLESFGLASLKDLP
ncbi:MAG: SMC-Scp complex subunit ScpB, partial [Phycisphaerales bacterium]|nr:SMC-Scp complex subunit ScpB [Phycisphaerales bacterium]